MGCSLKYERSLFKTGIRLVAGIDEAGRGPLAGPVVAAAVILKQKFRHKKLNDSKKLSHATREEIYEELTGDPENYWHVAVVDAGEIDRLNILRATHHAMRLAVQGLRTLPEHVLIDGLAVKPFPLHQTAIVGGDGLSLSIAAASVIAKVTRDRIMVEMHAIYPEYDFAQHKGYSTPEHIARLHRHGPCPIHRRSFEPVAQRVFNFQAQEGNAAEPSPHMELGRRGEDLAAKYLRKQGFKVLHRNFRSPQGGEVDIVCRDKKEKTLVFVEVKTRSSAHFGDPATHVTSGQQHRISRGALAWLRMLGNPNIVFRFDIVEVLVEESGTSISLIRNAFQLSEPYIY